MDLRDDDDDGAAKKIDYDSPTALFECVLRFIINVSSLIPVFFLIRRRLYSGNNFTNSWAISVQQLCPGFLCILFLFGHLI